VRPLAFQKEAFLTSKVCILIPVYNEERHIVPVLQKLQPYALDIILVNDGSTDQTKACISQALQTQTIHYLEHPENRGKGAALRTGFDFALQKGYSAVITMDGDGQHAPEEIPRFLEAGEKTDFRTLFLIGNRMEEKKTMPLVRWLSNRTMSFLISFLAKASLSDTQCGYRLIGCQILEKMHLTTSKFDTETEILIQSCRLGFPLLQVPIQTIYGSETSKIRVVSDTVRFIYLVFRYLFSFSLRPVGSRLD
jgi:glycosyltransferase involved in cell wall biosynthesis